MAGPAFRSATSDGETSGTSITLTAPAGISDNDILLAFIYKEDTGAVTYPSGFTEKQTVTQTASDPDFKCYLAWKRASSESGNYTFSWTNNVWRAGLIMAISGAILSGDPFDVAPSTNAPGSASATVTATGITTLTADTLLVALGAAFSSFTWTEPSGMTERVDYNNVSAATVAQAGIGATGDKSFTASGSDFNAAMLAAIKPVAAAAFDAKKASAFSVFF